MSFLDVTPLVFQNPIALLLSLGAAWLLYLWLVRRGVK